MADKKISALTGATTPLAGTEVLPIVQSGATVKVAVSDLTAGRAVTASSINKVAITAPATASTLTIADGKTLTASNTLTLAGTDATTQTFPTTNATIARTDAAQTFTGDQTVNGLISMTVNGAGRTVLSVYNSNNAAADGSGVQFGKFAADPFSRIWSNHNSGTLYFDTLLNFPFTWRNYMATSPVELMTLDGSGNLTPAANGTQSFGSTSLRWSQVWCTAGAFNTSDARLKTQVTLLTDIEKQAAAQFSKEIGTFQWLESIKTKGVDDARHHVGITVQRAKEILESFGLNPWRYGFMSYDKWDNEFINHPAVEAVDFVAAVYDETGKVITPEVKEIKAQAEWTEQTKVAGDAYAFRYDQLNMFIAAGIEYRLTALEAK